MMKVLKMIVKGRKIRKKISKKKPSLLVLKKKTWPFMKNTFLIIKMALNYKLSNNFLTRNSLLNLS